MTLDARIEKDLTERLKDGVIHNAEELNADFKSLTTFSTKGMPAYFGGDRKAKTVFVHLNPGINAGLADARWNFDTKHFSRTSTKSFIDDYKKSRRDARYDRVRFDAFDVKQAAFLYHWTGSGIKFPNIDWKPKTEKDQYEKEVAWLEAKEIVLAEKLQLELVPYASQTFNNCPLTPLFPYLETILEEIFRVERTYVIFGGNVFDGLFKEYNNQRHPDTFIDLTPKQSVPLNGMKKKDGTTWTDSLYYKVVGINFKGKKQKALIAHTFPKRNLGFAFDVMQEYGKKCCEAFNKTYF